MKCVQTNVQVPNHLTPFHHIFIMHKGDLAKKLTTLCGEKFQVISKNGELSIFSRP